MITTKIQIRFNDMDPMKRVNNSTYASYLELARLDFCNKYLTIKELDDIPFVLVRLEMDLKKSLRPMTSAEARIWVSKIGTTSWEFQYQILDSKNQDLYLEAKSIQVFYNYRKDVKEEIPQYFKEFLLKEMK